MAKPVESSQFLEVVGLYPRDTGSLTTDSVYFDLKGAFVIDTMNGLKVNSGAGNQVGGFTIAGGGITVTGAITFIELQLTRDAANVLAQVNSTNAQTLRIYNTYTDASNYERLILRGNASEFDIFSDSAGTGTARPLVIGTFGNANINFWTNSVQRWAVNASGHFVALTDNTYDIGASGANRPRNVFLSGGVTHGSATLLTTTAALTNGAAAQTATLTNGPAAGNPTKWVPINDNGTTRYIPAW